MRRIRLVMRLAVTAGSAVVPEDLEGAGCRHDDVDDEGCCRSCLQPMNKAVTRYRTKDGMRRGTPTSYGSKGATVVDHETGDAVRVPHGHYVHDEEDGDEKPASWKKQAQQHLELGPRSKHGIHAFAAMAADAGVEDVHALKREEISARGENAHVKGKRIEGPHAAAMARWLKQRPEPDSDLLSWEGSKGRQRLTPESLHAYRARIGALPEATHADPPKPKKATPRPAAMRKAVSAQLDRVGPAPGLAAETKTWKIGEFVAMFHARNGFNFLSIVGASLALPFHMVVANVADAERRARSAVLALGAGQVPAEGVFRRMELGEQLGLFGAMTSAPKTGPKKVVHVKPHLRHTEHGATFVPAHDRQVVTAAPEPAKPEPSAAAEAPYHPGDTAGLNPTPDDRAVLDEAKKEGTLALYALQDAIDEHHVAPGNARAVWTAGQTAWKNRRSADGDFVSTRAEAMLAAAKAYARPKPARAPKPAKPEPVAAKAPEPEPKPEPPKRTVASQGPPGMMNAATHPDADDEAVLRERRTGMGGLPAALAAANVAPGLARTVADEAARAKSSGRAASGAIVRNWKDALYHAALPHARPETSSSWDSHDNGTVEQNATMQYHPRPGAQMAAKLEHQRRAQKLAEAMDVLQEGDLGFLSNARSGMLGGGRGERQQAQVASVIRSGLERIAKLVPLDRQADGSVRLTSTILRDALNIAAQKYGWADGVSIGLQNSGGRRLPGWKAPTAPVVENDRSRAVARIRELEAMLREEMKDAPVHLQAQALDAIPTEKTLNNMNRQADDFDGYIQEMGAALRKLQNHPLRRLRERNAEKGA